MEQSSTRSGEIDGMGNAPAARILVIGFGNTLRRDDGLGCLIADEVARWNHLEVHALSVPQLTPELTIAVANAEIVIFVDARAGHNRSEIHTEPLEPSEEGGASMIHSLSPRFLLGLTRAAFQRCPTAWLVSVPAEDFAFGDGLSATAELGLRNALGMIKTLIDPGACHEPCASPACPIVGAPHSPPAIPGLRP
jgi:hydrogenase maturation protease